MQQATGRPTVLAADVGGTKIAAALVDGQGQVSGRRHVPTALAGPDALIAQLVRLLRELRGEPGGEQAAAVGIGLPAVLEPGTDRVLWAPNLPGVRDLLLREALEQALGLPVFLEYDGHTAVLGEWWLGAGRGCDNLVFVIIGTGIGGGMILDGKLYRGRDRLAGAAGWFTLTASSSPPDAARDCGQWEALAAGPGIVRRAVAALRLGGSSTLREEHLSAEQVFAAARGGDALAQELIAETAVLIGTGVANIVSLLNPDLVVLGGGVGRQPDLLEPVRSVVAAWSQPVSGASVRIESSRLGSDAGLFGAAYAAVLRLPERKEA